MDQKQIDKYLVKSILGRGGMGQVYLAEDPDLKQNVVIKEMLPFVNQESAERFKREAKLLFRLSHPNIIRPFHYISQGDYYSIVMEYVDGFSLKEVIDNNGPIPLEIAVFIISSICDALNYIHGQGIYHRDIKSSNIMLSYEGEVKLGDFGISSNLEDNQSSMVTQAGQILGTPAYLPPEIIEGDSGVSAYDARSDIYSLGVVLYESIIGQQPFGEGSYATIVNKITNSRYVDIDKAPVAIPKKLKRIIVKCLHKNPEKRYQSLKEIKKDLCKLISVKPDSVSDKENKEKIKKYILNEDDWREKKQEEPNTGKGNVKIPYTIAAIGWAAAVILFIMILFNHTPEPEMKPQNKLTRSSDFLPPFTRFERLEDSTVLTNHSLVQFEITLDKKSDYFEHYPYKKPEHVMVYLNRNDSLNSRAIKIKNDNTENGEITFISELYLLNTGEHDILITGNEYFEKQYLKMSLYPHAIQKNTNKDTEYNQKRINVTLSKRGKTEAKIKFTFQPSVDKNYLKINNINYYKWVKNPNLKFMTDRKYSIKFDAPDYYPHEDAIYIDESDVFSEFFIKLVQKEAQVEIKTNPAKAKIFIDGKDKGEVGGKVKNYASYGRTNHEILRISPDTYNFRFIKDIEKDKNKGYYYAEKKERLKSGPQKMEVDDFKLSYSLSVKSDPAGAVIIVNNEKKDYQGELLSPYGTTPRKLFFDQNKKIHLQLYNMDKNLYAEKTLQVNKDSMEMDLKLAPLPKVQFTNNGMETDISINGKPYFFEKGNRVINNQLIPNQTYHMNPGKYSLKVKYKEKNKTIWYSKNQQYPEISKTIELKPEGRYTVDLNLHHYFATLILNISNTYSMSFKRKAVADSKKEFWPISSFPMPVSQTSPILLKGKEEYEFKLEIDNKEFLLQLSPEKNTIYYLETDADGNLKRQFSSIPYSEENLDKIKIINWQKTKEKE